LEAEQRCCSGYIGDRVWFGAYIAALQCFARYTGRGGALRENLVAMAVQKDQAARLTYISEFIEEIKAFGLLSGRPTQNPGDVIGKSN
jgi:hypothetical protein